MYNQNRSERVSIQKIIIPRGAVDPNETTIIEIPQELRRAPIIIAQKLEEGTHEGWSTLGAHPAPLKHEMNRR